MIHDGSYTVLQLSVIPERSRDWVTMLLDHDPFAGHTGNALLVPTRDLPRSYEYEFPTVAGTCLDHYTPVLDIFLWQFARLWMGQTDGTAYIAAPVEHVHGALDDDMYLLKDPATMFRTLPEDCNLHWRSFSSAHKLPEKPEQSNFSSLLDLLRVSGVVMPETEADERLSALCERLAIPLRQKSGTLPCSKHSATTVLWLPPQAQGAETACLGTVFACWYGLDLDLDE